MNNRIQGTVPGQGSLPRRQVILTMAGVMLALFLASLDQTIVSTALPRITTDLGGFAQYAWVATAYLVASTVTLPIAGKLSDMYGRKWFLVAGIMVFLIGSVLCGISQTMTQLIMFRAFQGLGAGAIMGLAFIIIADLFPPSERGKYAGFLSGVFGLSSVIGPTLGGYLTDSLSWRWVFFVNIPLGVLIVFLFILFFPHLRPEATKQRVDYPGMVTMVLTIVPVMLALTFAGADYDWISLPILGTLAFSAAMGAIFLRIESRSEQPLIPLWLFRNRIVSVSAMVMFAIGFAMFAAIIFIPLYFQGVLGATATASGTFLTPMMLGVVVGSLISGQLLSRAGGHYRRLGMAGIAIMSLGLFLLSRMTVETGNGTAVANIVLVGFGLGVTMPLYVIAVQNAVPHSVMGVATSTINFSRTLGGVFGLAIVGSVMSSRFLSKFTDGLPARVKEVVPPSMLTGIADNPRALVSVEAQTRLTGLFEGFGEGGAMLLAQLMSTLREALSESLAAVFLVGFIVAILAFVINFFMKEIPLRKHH